MPVNSIDLSRKVFAPVPLKRMRCRGLFSGKAEVKNGYGVFDKGGHIDTEDFRNYTGLGSFSVCVWVRKSAIANGFAVCQARPFAVYLSDWIIAADKVLFWMGNKSVGSDTLLNDLHWHHLAFVWNKPKEQFRGYFDGGLLGESDVIKEYGGMGSVKIGARGDATSSFWHGGIAHVKIFLRALTDTEVRNVFHMASITDGLGSYYPLAEDARDYSGQGKDGINRGVVFAKGW